MLNSRADDGRSGSNSGTVVDGDIRRNEPPRDCIRFSAHVGTSQTIGTIMFTHDV